MRYKAIYKWSSDEEKGRIPALFNEWRDCGIMVELDDDGTFIRELGSDAGEPEDNTFNRDYNWVETELNRLADKIRELQMKCDCVEFIEIPESSGPNIVPSVLKINSIRMLDEDEKES